MLLPEHRSVSEMKGDERLHEPLLEKCFRGPLA